MGSLDRSLVYSHEAQRIARCNAAAPISTSSSELLRFSFPISVRSRVMAVASPVRIVEHPDYDKNMSHEDFIPFLSAARSFT